MTIIGKLSNTIEEDIQEQEQYNVPKVFKKNEQGLTLKKSLIISTLLHPATMFTAWLIVIILAYLGIDWALLNKPETPTKDIEFVLVNNPEATPIDKNTKNRADRNTRAGGIHDPKKPQAEPSPAPGTPGNAAKKPSKPKAAAQPKKTNTNQDLVKQIQKKQAQQAQQQAAKTAQTKPAEQPAPKHVTPKPVPPAPRPAPTATAPKIAQNPTSAMQIPVPKTTAPKLAGSYGGPVTGTRSGLGTTAGGTGTGRPAPSFTPSSGGANTGRFSGSGSGSGVGTGGYGGNGQAGNPGPGNPNGRPGIDAIKEPDFGPYMRELQRRIKMNWDPPKGNESKRVVLLFKIAKDGRLLSVRVSRSSGVQAADRAAISAVELTAPFKPLPPEFRGQSVDIQFTFDYNVFGASRY